MNLVPDPARAAAEAITAHRARLHLQWLNDENTKKFFRALDFRRMERLTAAARNSTRTGLENAKEHNLLVTANTVLNIIETYGPGSTYPYEDYDRSNRSNSSINPAL